MQVLARHVVPYLVNFNDELNAFGGQGVNLFRNGVTTYQGVTYPACGTVAPGAVRGELPRRSEPARRARSRTIYPHHLHGAHQAAR